MELFDVLTYGLVRFDQVFRVLLRSLMTDKGVNELEHLRRESLCKEEHLLICLVAVKDCVDVGQPVDHTADEV